MNSAKVAREKKRGYQDLSEFDGAMLAVAKRMQNCRIMVEVSENQASLFYRVGSAMSFSESSAASEAKPESACKGLSSR
ncbi:hypothetical protein VTP01DRAFT_1395 [Rhizomucor pusillus]|uniref:uncharacterized protein n=1 Tax=Rhizomucor pusillus TaxID=4840 RepID=UPI003744996A